jgi:molybdenum transport protein
MIYFTDYDIDRLIEDDAPLGDLTTFLLDIGHQSGRLTLKTRHSMTVSGTEEAERLYQKNGLHIHSIVPSGTLLNPEETIISASGKAVDLHRVWRSGLVMLEFASGIASRTRTLVDSARAVRPGIVVAGTRKHPPYLKKVALKALMAGGGLPHRTGLSDTILLFREHLEFAGGIDNIRNVISKIKSSQKEKKIVVEAHNTDEALRITKAGADVVQIDKMPCEEFSQCADACRAINSDMVMIAAGGINGNNAADYARAGADVLVTSWMYFSPPADIWAQLTSIP